MPTGVEGLANRQEDWSNRRYEEFANREADWASRGGIRPTREEGLANRGRTHWPQGRINWATGVSGLIVGRIVLTGRRYWVMGGGIGQGG